MRKKKTLAIAAVMSLTLIAMASCTPPPSDEPLATIVFDDVPGLCWGNSVVVDGTTVQVCQSSSPGTAVVVATAPVPGQPGCFYVAPNVFATARQNDGPSRLLVIDPTLDPYEFRYDTALDVANGPITIEILDTVDFSKPPGSSRTTSCG